MPATIVRSHVNTLNFSDNPIDELPDCFPDSFKQLFCCRCSLFALPPSLSENPELIRVVAASSQISELPQLPHIEILNMSRNKLTEFPTLSKRLQFLDLSCNSITAIPHHFSYADLSYNRFSNWPSHTILPKLFSLQISGNPLRAAISVDAFPNLRAINVTDTPIDLQGNCTKIGVIWSPPGFLRAGSRRWLSFGWHARLQRMWPRCTRTAKTCEQIASESG